MENLDSFKKRIQAIEEFSNRLDRGELSIDELVKLESLTRELYERTVILKYKAFENKVKPVDLVENVVQEPVQVEEVVETQKVIQLEEADEPTIDFSIFDSPQNDEVEEKVSEVEEMQFEAEIEPAKEPIVEPEIEQTQASNVSFWEQLNINNNSLSTQFEGAKLDTLVGAFGLNEKLRFINDLFDGSSESFSEAIKVLDSQSNLDSAKIKSSELAAKHGWDAEEEAVVDFMMMVNRRYA